MVNLKSQEIVQSELLKTGIYTLSQTVGLIGDTISFVRSTIGFGKAALGAGQRFFDGKQTSKSGAPQTEVVKEKEETFEPKILAFEKGEKGLKGLFNGKKFLKNDRQEREAALQVLMYGSEGDRFVKAPNLLIGYESERGKFVTLVETDELGRVRSNEFAKLDLSDAAGRPEYQELTKIKEKALSTISGEAKLGSMLDRAAKSPILDLLNEAVANSRGMGIILPQPERGKVPELDLQELTARSVLLESIDLLNAKETDSISIAGLTIQRDLSNDVGDSYLVGRDGNFQTITVKEGEATEIPDILRDLDLQELGKLKDLIQYEVRATNEEIERERSSQVISRESLSEAFADLFEEDEEEKENTIPIQPTLDTAMLAQKVKNENSDIAIAGDSNRILVTSKQKNGSVGLKLPGEKGKIKWERVDNNFVVSPAVKEYSQSRGDENYERLFTDLSDKLETIERDRDRTYSVEVNKEVEEELTVSRGVSLSR